MPPERAHSRQSLLGLVAGAAGLALFALTIRQTGLDPIAEGIRRVGIGFLVIIALSGARLAIRAFAWTLCTDARRGLRFREAFPAFVAGDALGNLTPLGLIASEPAKAAFARPRLTMMEALASLAIENLLYTLTVAIVIAAGTVALLFLFDVSPLLRQLSLVALVAIASVVAAAGAILRANVRVISTLVDWLESRGLIPRTLRGRLDKLRALEDTVYRFGLENPKRLVPVLVTEAMFHLLGVAEVYVTLVLLLGAAAPGLLATFVLEAVNRTINVVFKFVPLRLGVDEVGSELLTRTLGLDPGLGVTMAIVRKVRMLVWSGVGVAILAKRGLVRTGVVQRDGV